MIQRTSEKKKKIYPDKKYSVRSHMGEVCSALTLTSSDRLKASSERVLRFRTTTSSLTTIKIGMQVTLKQ